MKVLTRLVYSLAILVFGFGLYLALKLHELGGRTESAKAAAASRPDGGKESQTARTIQGSSGEVTLPKPKPWLSDPNHGKESLRRFLATKRPDHEEMRAIANQVRVRIRFNELYDLLGLDKAGIARFETAAAKAGLNFAELVGANEESTQAYESGQARNMDKVVTETLGADYVPAFRAYLETSDLRLVASELAVNSYYTDTPLTARQADQFIRIALENRDQATPGPRINPDTINWDAVATRAGEFLTPAQLRSLQAMIARRQFDREFKDATGLPMRRPVRGL